MLYALFSLVYWHLYWSLMYLGFGAKLKR